MFLGININGCLIIDAAFETSTVTGAKLAKAKASTSKFKSFGFEVETIDGHNFNEIYEALLNAKNSNKPYCIIANTIKGKGVSYMENNLDWHGNAPKGENLEIALKELGGEF